MLVNNKKVKYSGSSWLIILQPSSREEINYTFEMQKNNNKEFSKVDIFRFHA